MKLMKIKNCKGMTLVELLAALTIMSIIVVAITGLMTQQLKSFDTTQSQVEVQENLRGVLDEIVSNIRVSSGPGIEIYQDNGDGSETGDPQHYNYSGNSTTVSGNQIKANGNNFHLHKTTKDKITKVYKSLSNKAPLTSPELNITQLNFQGLQDGTINITITGVSAMGNSLSYQLKAKVKPRVD